MIAKAYNTMINLQTEMRAESKNRRGASKN